MDSNICYLTCSRVLTSKLDLSRDRANLFPQSTHFKSPTSEKATFNKDEPNKDKFVHRYVLQGFKVKVAGLCRRVLKLQSLGVDLDSRGQY